jgi:hypothetical protein
MPMPMPVLVHRYHGVHRGAGVVGRARAVDGDVRPSNMSMTMMRAERRLEIPWQQPMCHE